MPTVPESLRPKSRRVHGPYFLYGLRLKSAWPLPHSTTPIPYVGDVLLKRAGVEHVARILETRSSALQGTDAWTTARVGDGATYLRWTNVFDFVVQRDGRSVLCCPLTDHPTEAFHTHLGPSLSFALINLGVEPLHSTTVIVNGSAVALIGDCGFGKSSLGASFVKAGYSLLTDDLLVLECKDEGFVAYPGAPRVKLYPEIARTIFGSRVRGLRLAPFTPKLIIPLDGARSHTMPAPLKAVYVMRPPQARTTSRKVSIRSLSARSACLELVRNTFNMAVTDSRRLERQLEQASRLSLTVPMKSLSYPREISMLACARQAILEDLSTRD